MGIRFISQIDLFQCSTHVFNKDSCRACGSYLIPSSVCNICGEYVSWICAKCNKMEDVTHSHTYCRISYAPKKGHKENKDYIIYNSLCDYLGIP